MKKILLMLSLGFPVFMQCGIAENTLVHTVAGVVAINALKQGDSVACADEHLAQHMRSVKSTREVAVDECVEVTTDDNATLCLSVDQYVFVPFKWVSVRDLSLNDSLLKKNGTFVHISNICRKKQPLKMVFIEVDEHANFFASQDGILVHNGLLGATIGGFVGMGAVTAVFGGLYAAVNVGVTCVAGPIVAGAVTATVIKVCAPAQAVATKTATIACGVIGGTLTGPV